MQCVGKHETLCDCYAWLQTWNVPGSRLTLLRASASVRRVWLLLLNSFTPALPHSAWSLQSTFMIN